MSNELRRIAADGHRVRLRFGLLDLSHQQIQTCMDHIQRRPGTEMSEYNNQPVVDRVVIDGAPDLMRDMAGKALLQFQRIDFGHYQVSDDSPRDNCNSTHE